MLQRFISILLTRIKLVFRDKTSLFFAFIFPMILVSVFGLLIVGSRSISNVEVTVFTPTQTAKTKAFIEAMKSSVFKVTETTDYNASVQNLKDNKIRFLIEVKETDTINPVSVNTTYNISSRNDYQQLIKPVLEGISSNINYAGIEVPKKYIITEGQSVGSKINQEASIMNGFILQSLVLYTIIGAASTISDEKQKNLLKRLGITRIKRSEFILAYLLSFLIVGFVQTCILILLSKFAFGVEFANIPLLLFVSVIMNALFSFIGIFVGAAAKNANAANGLSNIISFPLVILSGAWFSITFMPKWIQDISKFSPITAARSMFDEVSAISTPDISLFNMVVILISMLVFFILSVIFLRFKRL